MITSRKHSRKVSVADSAELEAIVFDLVRNRLLDAVGAGGMWTLQFRSESDTDAIFGETIAEVIARDVAGNIAADYAAPHRLAVAEATPAEAATGKAALTDLVPNETPLRDASEDQPGSHGSSEISKTELTGFDDAFGEIERHPVQLVA